jgi:hypothetical protein
MPIGAFLQKRRQVRHGESVLWRTAALRSALRALKPRRRCLGLSPSPSLLLAIVTAAILLPVLLTSCGKKGQEGEKKTAQKSEDDFLDKDAKPDDGETVLYRCRQPKIRGCLRATLQPRQGADVS